MRRTLIRNGLVIDTEPEVVVHPGTDVLIEDDHIAAVGRGLVAEDATVIDATGHVVLPGFVDTHRHTWQTALRGIAADADLGEYLNLVLGRIGPRYRPEDVRIGTLAGALECLESGITTVQDFSHVQHTPEHADAAVAALRDSGVRAVFGHGQPVFGPAPAPEEVVRVRDLVGDDRLVTMALAPAGPSYAPMDEVERSWALARELGLRIFIHVGSGPVAALPVEALRDRGLLDANTTFVHGNSLPDSELALIAAAGSAVSIAPAVEAQMGFGAPMINRLRHAGITTGLGVDVVTTVAGDMFSLMRAAVQTAGGQGVRAADVLRMATVDGAATLGMADRIGSLRPGKQADVVLLRLDDTNLVGGLHNPVGTVVTAAHPGNVDTVLVAGRVVKRGGRLVHDSVAGAVRRSAEHLASVADSR